MSENNQPGPGSQGVALGFRSEALSPNEAIVYAVVCSFATEFEPSDLTPAMTLESLDISGMRFDNFVIALASKAKHGSFLDRNMTLAEAATALDSYDQHIDQAGMTTYLANFRRAIGVQ